MNFPQLPNRDLKYSRYLIMCIYGALFDFVNVEFYLFMDFIYFVTLHIISQVHSPILNILKDSKAQKHKYFCNDNSLLLSALWNIIIHIMESN